MIKIMSVLLAVVVVLTACSPQQNETTPFIADQEGQTNQSEVLEEIHPPNDEPQDSDTLEVSIEYPPIPSANPLDLTISLDETNLVETEIGLEGGMLEVRSTDGTVFILEIPDYALLSPESIRITPISSPSGRP